MILARAIPRATSLLPRVISSVPKRHGSGGASDLEIVRDLKRHIDDIPVPTRSWSESYNEAQKVFNMKLYLSIGATIVATYLSYKWDVFLVAPFMYKKSDIVLTDDMKLHDYDED